MIVLELAVIAFVFWADAHKLVPVSKTPFLFLLGWASLRLRGLRWRSVGMFIWGSWRATVIAGVLGGIAIELLELFCHTAAVDAPLPPRSRPFAFPCCARELEIACACIGAYLDAGCLRGRDGLARIHHQSRG